MNKVQHVGIAVRDLDAALDFYGGLLSIEIEGRLEWPALGLRAATLTIGETKLELIQPVEPRGDLARGLADLAAEKDGAVHHLAFEVDDLDAAVERLKRGGVRMMTAAIQEGAGGRLIWLHPDETPGVMIELVEKGYRIT